MLSLCALMCNFSLSSKAQCPVNQFQVSIVIQTDGYGYEGYWEVVPGSNAFGTGTITSGGNATQVGCNGGGPPYTATSGNGYANNTTYNTHAPLQVINEIPTQFNNHYRFIRLQSGQ